MTKRKRIVQNLKPNGKYDYAPIGTFLALGAFLLGNAMLHPAAAGMMGAYLARPLIALFGFSAWLVPVSAALLGIRLMFVEVRHA